MLLDRLMLAVARRTLPAAGRQWLRAAVSALPGWRSQSPGIAFICLGGTGASPNMGRELYEAEPFFRASIDASIAVIEKVVGTSFAPFVQDSATPSDEKIRLALVQIAQVDLWRSAGVEPSAAVGLSLGESTAAYAAGVLSREDAVRVICAVSEITTRHRACSRLFVMAATTGEAQRMSRRAPQRLDYIGNLTTRTAHLLSSYEDEAANRAFLRAEGTIVGEHEWQLRSHTTRMAGERSSFVAALGGLRYRAGCCPVYSSVAGAKVSPEMLADPSFWWWMGAQPFHFDEALGSALREDIGTVINIGVHPSVNRSILETARSLGRSVRIIDTTRQEEPESVTWKRARKTARGSRRATASDEPRVDAATFSYERPRGARDIFEAYEALRAAGSVHFLPRYGAWIVLSYSDVQQALAAPHVFSSNLPLISDADAVLVGADPPQHTFARKLLTGLFSPQKLDECAATARRVAASALEPLVRGGQIEVVREIAQPVAHAVAAQLIGLDDDAVARLSVEGTSDADHAAALRLVRDVLDPVAPHTNAYDVLRSGGDGLDDEAARSVVRLLWVAATSTQVRTIAASVLLLLERPEIREQLIDNEQLVPSFVEESFRLRPPQHVLPRRVVSDVTIAGVKIPAGATAHLCIAAANRDAARFESASSLLLDRRSNPHLSFGAGVHRCIGAPIARMTTAAAVASLLRAAPAYCAMQPLGTVRYHPGVDMEAIEKLVIGS